MTFKTLKNYAKYSGFEVTLVLNPFQWAYTPTFEKYPRYEDEKWIYGEAFRGYFVSFLGLKIDLWIDDNYGDSFLL